MSNICRDCEQEKDIEEFYIHKTKYKNKIYVYHKASCKNCLLSKMFAYKQKNRNKFLQCQKEYRLKNKDKIHNYYIKNKIHFINNTKKHRKEHPWLSNHRGIVSRCENPDNPYYKKGIKNFLTTTNIKYLWFRDRAYLMKRPSIDRINPKGHYVLDNCRYLELIDNIKRQYTR